MARFVGTMVDMTVGEVFRHFLNLRWIPIFAGMMYYEELIKVAFVSPKAMVNGIHFMAARLPRPF